MFRCDVCGNKAIMVEDSGMPISCCGKEMKETV